MITPNYSLTATERRPPSVMMDFLSGSVDARVATTRALNTATRTNSSGVIETVLANTPRIDYDPVTGACLGLLQEETRQNLLLNTDTLTTQNVTVTAVAHTLSFYGAGQIVLSGVHSATVIGTGAYPSRQTYTFTPTAGTLTVTVTGTVQYANLEVGAFATSYIPNAGSQNTRNTDFYSVTGANFTSWFFADLPGTLAAKVIKLPSSIQTINSLFDVTGATTNFRLRVNTNSTKAAFYTVVNSGVTQVNVSVPNALIDDTTVTACAAFAAGDFVMSANAVNSGASAGTLPTLTQLTLGASVTGAGSLNGRISYLKYWPVRLTTTEVRAFAK